MNIKAIIFDWARTLYDVNNNTEFLEAEEILKYCKKKDYYLILVSLVAKIESVPGTSLKTREEQINNSSLGKYFDKVLVVEGDKDQALDELIKELNFSRKEVMMVDDRMIRSIQYGNRNGHPTVWLQKGTFADELPNLETGMPTFTIKTLSELKDII